jgi:hypothetical protein
MASGMAQVVEWLPNNRRPWVQTPVLSIKKKLCRQWYYGFRHSWVLLFSVIMNQTPSLSPTLLWVGLFWQTLLYRGYLLPPPDLWGIVFISKCPRKRFFSNNSKQYSGVVSRWPNLGYMPKPEPNYYSWEKWIY